MQGGPVCFPISLCDLIGILAQVLARMMGPDPLPRNSPQGPLFCDQESPGGGRGASTFSAPALSSCPPRRPPRLGAWGQRRPRQAPPRAARAPPATRRPQSPTPGAPDGYEPCSHAAGTAPASTPGLGSPPTLAERPLVDLVPEEHGQIADRRGIHKLDPVALRKLRSTQAEAVSSTLPMPSPPLFPCWAVNRVALMAEDVCEPRFLHP